MKFTNREEELILAHSGLPKVVSDAAKGLYRSDPKRRYHTWDHALSVLSWVNYAVDGANNNGPALAATVAAGYTGFDLSIAALFHDAVYTTQGSPENERQSIVMMRKSLGGLFYEGSFLHKYADLDRISKLIDNTARHGSYESGDLSVPEEVLLDCDLASFGEERWEIALWNDENIVEEIMQRPGVTRQMVRDGRRKFLTMLTNKKSIFLTSWFRDMFENTARKNIRRVFETMDREEQMEKHG